MPVHFARIESVEGLDPSTDAAIQEAMHACIQETDLDSRLDNVTDRTVVWHNPTIQCRGSLMHRVQKVV